MKKLFIYSLVMILLALLLVGCENNVVTPEDTNINTSTEQNIDFSDNEFESSTQQITEFQETVGEQTTESNAFLPEKETYYETTTNRTQSNSLISNEDLSKIENSQAEVYFSDNPNNKYIQMVAWKYNVKTENLIALIKVNSEFPSTLVFEFSGKVDSNGELDMSYSELKNVYNIDDTNNNIVKASKNGLDNDGVTFVEARVMLTLAKEYFIPELQNLKQNKPYIE